MDFFPGISTLIHLLIILFYRVAEKINLYCSFRPLRKIKLSYFIMFSILALVTVSAFLLIKISLKDNNFQMAKNLISTSHALASGTDNNSVSDSESRPKINLYLVSIIEKLK
jgi:hypothetical protein